MSYGPYGKGLSFQEGYPSAWRLLSTQHPDAVAGSSNKYQCWELVDPETWVPDGYACLRVDSRGAGRSPGYLDPWSPRETHDFYHCIEWAGLAPWCNGKVGLNGISYYAITAWHVAALQPPHLAAFCGGQGLHPRGNYEGFMRAASRQKWLEVHGLEHWTHFYTGYGVRLQKRFFGHFLKGEDTGWARQPAVQLQVRHPGERFVERHESEWPIARTEWTRLY